MARVPPEPTFPPADLAAIGAAPTVRIETRGGPAAPVHRTVIRVVVDGGEVFVRSVRGPRGRWYRELLVWPDGALHVRRASLAVRAIPAADAASIERCSRALEHKYAGDPALGSMLRPETLPTTLRLVPDTADAREDEG